MSKMKNIFRCLFFVALVLPCALFARRDEGLLIYMDFDNPEDATVNPMNISGTDRAPTILGTRQRARLEDGKFVRSVLFANSNGNRTMPNNYAINLGELDGYYKSGFSVAFWFKTDKKGSTEAMISGNKDWLKPTNPGWAITMIGGKNFSVSVGGKNIDVDFSKLTDGEWHHVALVVDRKTNKISFYGDGKKLRSEDVPAGTIGNGESETLIGGSGRGAFSAPNAAKKVALVDDYGIWTRPLTDKEVASMWREGNGARVPEPSAFAPVFGIVALAAAIGLSRRRRRR